MEVKAKLSSLHMAPRKVRLAAGLIRRLPVPEAVKQLQFLNKAAARPMLKLLQSAMANAEHNFKLDPGKLWIKHLTVDGGMVIKRYRPRAYGRAGTIRKRTSHVILILSDEPQMMKVKKVYKSRKPRKPATRTQNSELGTPKAEAKKEAEVKNVETTKE